jgi:hydrogenase nickel incorporation protein HypA/HybF
MHELSIAVELVDVLIARSAGARVKRVVVEVGALCAVLPEALAFCFDLVIEGTAVEGASLELVVLPGKARCVVCTEELSLMRPFGRCTCGSTELDWLSGDELRVSEMEVT